MSWITTVFLWFSTVLWSLRLYRSHLQTGSISGTEADSFLPYNYRPDEPQSPHTLYTKWNVQEGRPLQGSPTQTGVSPKPREPSIPFPSTSFTLGPLRPCAWLETITYMFRVCSVYFPLDLSMGHFFGLHKSLFKKAGNFFFLAYIILKANT